MKTLQKALQFICHFIDDGCCCLLYFIC